MQGGEEQTGPVEQPAQADVLGDAGAVIAAGPHRAVDPVVVPRWIQAVLLPLALLGLWALLRAAGAVVLLFVIAAIIALLLNPFVGVLRRIGLPRGVAVAAVYLGVVLAVATIATVLADPVAKQVSAVSEQVPEFVDDANAALADLQGWLDDKGIDLQVQDPGRTALETLGDRLTEGSGELVSFTQDALTLLVEASLALILIIVLSIYMLLYGEKIGTLVRRAVPPGDGTPEDDFPTRIEAAVFGYVRGQLLFSTIMGASAGLALWIMGSLGIFEEGKRYALFFGAWYAFAELIPYVGPAIGGAPAVFIALLGDDPLDALWLTIMFTGLQQIEGHIVAPQVFAHSLRINPILVIAALLLGGQLYGIIGAFIALPIAAMLRETVVYMRRHLVLEPWGTPTAMQLAGVGAVRPPPTQETISAARASEVRCPECGTPRAAGAAFCSACGTELGPADEAAAAASAAPG